MIKRLLSPFGFWLAIFFCVIGVIIISGVIEMTSEQVEKFSIKWYHLLVFAIAPFGLFSRIREYWESFYKKEFPQFVLTFFLTETVLLYLAVLFSAMFLLLFRVEQLQLSLFYLKVLAGMLTISFMVVMFFIERKKIKSKIEKEAR